MLSFQNRLGQVGREEGKREDSTDIAFVEPGCLRKRALIRQFAAEDTVNPIVRPSYGPNQRRSGM
jgi:hypothetical protein